MSNENETIKNGGQWDLGILYDSFDDPKLAADVDTMRKKIDEVNAIAPALANMPHKDLLHRYIDLNETISLLSYKLFGYANLVYATNTSDVNAAGLMGRMQAMLSEISAADTVIRHAISDMGDLEELIATDGTLKEYAFFLRKIKDIRFDDV